MPCREAEGTCTAGVPLLTRLPCLHPRLLLLLVLLLQTIVGYDTTSAPPTWLVQNSYGASWGVDGRMRIRMDWSGHGVCGMYLNVQAPT